MKEYKFNIGDVVRFKNCHNGEIVIGQVIDNRLEPKTYCCKTNKTIMAKCCTIKTDSYRQNVFEKNIRYMR